MPVNFGGLRTGSSSTRSLRSPRPEDGRREHALNCLSPRGPPERGHVFCALLNSYVFSKPRPYVSIFKVWPKNTYIFRDAPLKHFQTLTRTCAKHLPRSPNTSRQASETLHWNFATHHALAAHQPIGFLVDAPSQEHKTIYPRSRGQCL